jgi:hypothetical protein
MNKPASRLLRCAIYTRKSTEHNLDLAFTSLDAQREACEAYIKSQHHEGWRLLPERYDDGGFSGASLTRPALQALLEQVRQHQIDIVVVYKVDRLTRSLADFAKLVELFDSHAVSFVSVDDLSFLDDNNVLATTRRVRHGAYPTAADYARALSSEEAVLEEDTLGSFDVVFLRYNPTREALGKLASPILDFGWRVRLGGSNCGTWWVDVGPRQRSVDLTGTVATDRTWRVEAEDDIPQPAGAVGNQQRSYDATKVGDLRLHTVGVGQGVQVDGRSVRRAAVSLLHSRTIPQDDVAGKAGIRLLGAW